MNERPLPGCFTFVGIGDERQQLAQLLAAKKLTFSGWVRAHLFADLDRRSGGEIQLLEDRRAAILNLARNGTILGLLLQELERKPDGLPVPFWRDLKDRLSLTRSIVTEIAVKLQKAAGLRFVKPKRPTTRRAAQ